MRRRRLLFLLLLLAGCGSGAIDWVKLARAAISIATSALDAYRPPPPSSGGQSSMFLLSSDPVATSDGAEDPNAELAAAARREVDGARALMGSGDRCAVGRALARSSRRLLLVPGPAEAYQPVAEAAAQITAGCR